VYEHISITDIVADEMETLIEVTIDILKWAIIDFYMHVRLVNELNFCSYDRCTYLTRNGQHGSDPLLLQHLIVTGSLLVSKEEAARFVVFG
jgi:hypothetical protein